MRNPRTQFEIKTCYHNKDAVWQAYQWCLKNLKLKDERGVIYQVDELFIITSSQKVIDKVNKHFGSSFNFECPFGNRCFFIK